MRIDFSNTDNLFGGAGGRHEVDCEWVSINESSNVLLGHVSDNKSPILFDLWKIGEVESIVSLSDRSWLSSKSFSRFLLTVSLTLRSEADLVVTFPSSMGRFLAWSFAAALVDFGGIMAEVTQHSKLGSVMVTQSVSANFLEVNVIQVVHKQL